MLNICFRKQPKNNKDAKTVGPIEPEKLPPNANNQTTENGNLLNGNKVENPVFNSTPNIIETTLPTISSQYTATVKSGSTLHAPDYHSLSHKLTKQFYFLERLIRIRLEHNFVELKKQTDLNILNILILVYQNAVISLFPANICLLLDIKIQYMVLEPIIQIQ